MSYVSCRTGSYKNLVIKSWMSWGQVILNESVIPLVRGVVSLCIILCLALQVLLRYPYSYGIVHIGSTICLHQQSQELYQFGGILSIACLPVTGCFRRSSGATERSRLSEASILTGTHSFESTSEYALVSAGIYGSL